MRWAENNKIALPLFRLCSRREGTLQTQDNRRQIPEMIKQFLVIIVSLALANAFHILTHRPDTDKDNIVRIFQHYSAPYPAPVDSNQSIFDGGNLIVCIIYVLICARFLFHHWLYMSTVYADLNRPRQRIRFEAIGVVLTGIFLGVQSYYTAARTFYDFISLFTIILGIDFLISVPSLLEDRAVLFQNQKRGVLYWILNNIAFGLFFVFWLLHVGTSTEVDLTFWRLAIVFVVLNCGLSGCITFYNYVGGGSGNRP
jgi:hypothetical protein